jgi:hypothetical protein
LRRFPGGFGGTRVLQSLLPVLLDLMSTFSDGNFLKVSDLFDEND